MQGAQVWSLVRELRFPRAAWHSQKINKLFLKYNKIDTLDCGKPILKILYCHVPIQIYPMISVAWGANLTFSGRQPSLSYKSWGFFPWFWPSWFTGHIPSMGGSNPLCCLCLFCSPYLGCRSSCVQPIQITHTLPSKPFQAHLLLGAAL